MNKATIYRYLLSLTLVFSLLILSIPQVGYAQTAAQMQSSDLPKSLAVIEEKLEARRKELGIPGVSLVIVKDDEVIYSKGLGYKDFEKKIAVTPDTQFAIGSATKAFTALSVLMSADEGKLSLADSPKKYLPYFKINDPEIDAKITIRDLLRHASGLNRTDLAMITGKLNREQLIKIAGEAKPTAKLGEKFQYQNIMFTAAGVLDATVAKMPWEKLIVKRIFTPLGMTNSSMSIAEMKTAKDYSFGYDYNFDTKETRKLPLMDIDDAAPAGSINSSANDMANWLKFVINGGSVNGKRLVSEKNFQEWTKPQMNIGGKTNYGYGWFLQDWNGMKVVQHGGNVQGFNSMVAMIPEKKLGFVLLTNVSGSPLGNEMMSVIWENLIGSPKVNTNNVAANELSKEVGTYNFKEAGFDIEIKMQDGKLVAIVPGQPTYTLENIGGRKYKLKEVDGFFATFKDDSVFLEQPQGNFTLSKASAKPAEMKTSDAAKELIGKYSTPNGKGTIEIKSETDGKVTFNIEGQQPYALGEKSKDLYSMSPLPDSYFLTAKRDSANKIISVVVTQPEGEFEFKLIDAKMASDAMPKISVDEVMQKTIAAMGGESALKKITSRVTKMDIDFIHQGVKGTAVSYAKAPSSSATQIAVTAFGKTIATINEHFDGTGGGSEISFAPSSQLSGKQLENTRLASDFYGLMSWKNSVKKITLKGIEKVGEDDCYIISFAPENASEIKYWISTKTFLPMKQQSLNVDSTSQQTTPTVSVLSDYRAIDGVLVPFKTVTTDIGMGDIVITIKEVRQNVKIDGKVFKAQK